MSSRYQGWYPEVVEQTCSLAWFANIVDSAIDLARVLSFSFQTSWLERVSGLILKFWIKITECRITTNRCKNIKKSKEKNHNYEDIIEIENMTLRCFEKEKFHCEEILSDSKKNWKLRELRE